MSDMQKVTVQLPRELVERAQRASKTTLTGAIRRGLELVAAKDAYDRVRRLRGKVDLGLDLAALRDDGRDTR